MSMGNPTDQVEIITTGQRLSFCSRKSGRCTRPGTRDTSMFVLAHLSDPHLGPLPTPRLSELIGKRATGFLNWRRKRQLIHRGDVLTRIVADLQAQMADHIAVTGDLVNLSLAGEYAPARAWLASLGSPRDVTLVPGNHDVLGGCGCLNRISASISGASAGVRPPRGKAAS